MGQVSKTCNNTFDSYLWCYFFYSGEVMDFLKILFNEMTRGNFSFAILIVGIAQFVIMLINFYKKGGN